MIQIMPLEQFSDLNPTVPLYSPALCYTEHSWPPVWNGMTLSELAVAPAGAVFV